MGVWMPFCRRVLATSNPSRLGSITSSTITSKGSPVARAIAVFPSPAVSTL
jgi:hypothetical protein